MSILKVSVARCTFAFALCVATMGLWGCGDGKTKGMGYKSHDEDYAPTTTARYATDSDDIYGNLDLPSRDERSRDEDEDEYETTTTTGDESTEGEETSEAETTEESQEGTVPSNVKAESSDVGLMHVIGFNTTAGEFNGAPAISVYTEYASDVHVSFMSFVRGDADGKALTWYGGESNQGTRTDSFTGASLEGVSEITLVFACFDENDTEMGEVTVRYVLS